MRTYKNKCANSDYSLSNQENLVNKQIETGKSKETNKKYSLGFPRFS